MKPFSLNIKGKLYEYTRQPVMGILNITADSFYAPSASLDREVIRANAHMMIDEGADIVDVGAYSTRPGYKDVSVETEIEHLAIGIQAVKDICPEIPVSVDTFRAEVARVAVTGLGADIVNDISGGNGDAEMFDTVAELKVPYVLTHCQGSVETMHQSHQYTDIVAEVLRNLAEKVSQLSLLGVNDIIIDPGFGFSKQIHQNYQLLSGLQALTTLDLPILVGVSCKSMITKVLDISAEEAQNGTTVLQTMALERGASILRVHDVRAAKEAITLVDKIYQNIP